MAFCIRCGAQLQEGAGFCNNCGAAQNGGAQAAPQMPPHPSAPSVLSPSPQGEGVRYQQPPKKSSTGLIIGLVCGGAALIAGLVVLILLLTGVIGKEADTAATGDTGAEEEYPDALTIGTDIPLEQITSVSFDDGNSMERFGEGYSISRDGDSIRYIAYESHMKYDEAGEEEVRTEWETDLTAEEWNEMLSLLEGAVFYRFPHEVLDGYSYYRIEWETKPSDGIFRDSIHFPDETKRKAYSALRQELAARAGEGETDGEETASGVNVENEEIQPLMTETLRSGENEYRPDLDACFYFICNRVYAAPDTSGAGYDAIRAIYESEEEFRTRMALSERFNDPAFTDPEANNYIAYNDNLYARRMDTAVVSVFRETVQMEYWNGSYQESIQVQSHNVDAATGEEILLTDVVTDIDALGAYAAELIREREYREESWTYVDLLIEEADLEREITAVLQAGEKVHFGLAYYNLVLVFEDGVLYNGYGTYTLELPFAGRLDAFNASYTQVPAKDVGYIAKLLPDHDNRIMTDEGEKILRVETDDEIDAESGWPSGDYTLTLDGVVTEGNEDALLDITPYYVRHYSGDYLWLYASHMASANNRNVIVYRLEDGALTYVGTTESFSYFIGDICAGSIMPQEMIQTIGTVSGHRYMYIGENGMPTISEYEGKPEPYRITDAAPLILKQTLTCEAYENYGEGMTEKVEDQTLSPGEILQYYETDGETYVDFRPGNSGLIVRIYFEHGDQGCTVNGTPVDELFDNVMWAG